MSEFSKPEFRFEVRLLKVGFVKRTAGVSVSAGWMKGCFRLDEQKDTLQLFISSSVNVMAADAEPHLWWKTWKRTLFFWM